MAPLVFDRWRAGDRGFDPGFSPSSHASAATPFGNPEGHSSMHTNKHMIAAVFATAIVAQISCGAAAAQPASSPPAVSVTPVVSRTVTETGDYIGRVTAIDKVDVVARVPGFIEERTFTEGQLVKKGDLLFRIEQATYQTTVEQARATLARAKANEVNAKLQLER